MCIRDRLQGEVLPDYKTCIEISSQGALKEMRVPAVMAILFPVVCGFLFGAWFVGGLLIGATISAIMLAIFTGNAGGAWDNAKKYVETGAIKGHGKGSPAHDAAVVEMCIRDRFLSDRNREVSGAAKTAQPSPAAPQRAVRRRSRAVGGRDKEGPIC